MDLSPGAAHIDRCLTETADRLDYLLTVTPLDAEGAWRAFEASAFREAPRMTYRALHLDPEAERRALEALDLETVEDPAIAGLLGRLRDELVALCRMLAARGSGDFLAWSTEVHGEVDDAELAVATAVLEVVHGWSADWVDEAVDARGFAAAARAELDRLRERHPDLEAGVEIRDDVHGVMVLRGQVLVDVHARIDPRRVQALVQHEVGTHVVTEVNGARQPLRSLQSGLAGYESTQEGIAVLAEHAVGGLTTERLALLAARVLAARRCADGAPFPDTVAELCADHGFAHRPAFDVVLRIHRGGGLMKDAGYLRGLGQALAYLGAGKPLDPLLVGKAALDDTDDIADLLARGVLDPPVVRPRWVEMLDRDALPADLPALATALR